MNDNHAQAIPLDGPYLDILSHRQNGLCCSQILVKLILQDMGRENPDLVRSMAALCYGSGYSEGTCGLLTGAACALSLGLESHPDRERADALLTLMLDELFGWFTVKAEAAYGGSRCVDILAASPDKRACTLLLMGTLEKLTTMLASTPGAKKRI
ncbi:MAG: DVU_1555 family C-GCAxxG-C-C protein [Desulfuromonadales bacterium]